MNQKKAKKPHATRSWEQMMSQAQLNALKPYIDQQVQLLVHAQFQKTLRLLLENISSVQVRVWALERTLSLNLPVTKENLEEATADIEDESQNMEEIAYDEGAAAMDTLRIAFTSKNSDEAEFGKSQKTIIHKLTNKVGGLVQTYDELEAALVGIKKGEEREVVIVAKEPGEKDTTLRITASRISRKKPSPVRSVEAPAAEAPAPTEDQEQAAAPQEG